eukprot:Mrub_04315.p1 GENE.Mrub_04315~~Mrub_04315.p1  ORF type:complete len:414 (+),score=91.63 Mrub_04315:58-1242(+)
MNMKSFLSKTDLEVIALALEIYESKFKKLDFDYDQLYNGFKLEALFKNKKIKIFRSKNSEIKNFQERQSLNQSNQNQDVDEDLDEDGFTSLKSKKKFIKPYNQPASNTSFTSINTPNSYSNTLLDPSDTNSDSNATQIITNNNPIDTNSMIDLNSSIDNDISTDNNEIIDEDCNIDDYDLDENEEEDIEWICEDNINLSKNKVGNTDIINKDDKDGNGSSHGESKLGEDYSNKVFISTMDYTMQNLILMMFSNYLCLVTLDNLKINSTTYYAKRCYACGWFDLSGSKEFCGDCGHHTMKRVMAKVNGDVLELHYRDRVIHNSKKVHTDNVALGHNKMNYNRNVVLTEDEMLYMRQKKKVKVVQDEYFEGGMAKLMDEEVRYGVNGSKKKKSKRC